MTENLDWRLLKKLYAIHSSSGKETRMIQFVASQIKAIPGATIWQDRHGNLYAAKGQADTYPCIVAHLDQVQPPRTTGFRVGETRDIIFGYSPQTREFQGLGADDKNGIFIALEALKKFDYLKCAFFKEEETGCKGSANADMTFFSDCRFVIECDRRGNSDFITSIGTADLCSGKFISDIDPERWGYKEEQGMMTDVEALKGNGLSVSAANISCGYYNPHTDYEVTDKRDLEKCWRFVCHIIEDCTDTYPHELRDAFCYCDEWEIEEDIFAILQQDPTLTAADLYATFQECYPMLTQADFARIVDEYRLFYGPDDSLTAELP